MKTSAVPSAHPRSTGATSVRQLRRPGAAAPGPGAALPAPLRQGIEALSGLSMDAVRVHADSPEPARVGALAYAQGTDIHLGPGQEQHLPHEAWHVVQQLQGRVKPTLQLRAAGPVNDDPALEHEADIMGQRALQTPPGAAAAALPAPMTGAVAVVQRLSSALAKAYKKRVPDADALAIWQEDADLSDTEMDALESAGKLVLAYDLIEADKMPPKSTKGRLSAILALVERLANAQPKTEAPRTLRERVMDAVGMVTTIADPVLSGGKASDKALGAFLDSKHPDTEAILHAVASGTNTLKGVLKLLDDHAANYSHAQLLAWAGSYGDARTAQALVDTAHEIHAGYVSNWLLYGVTASSPTQLQQLVRFQALMATGARLVVIQPDKWYQRDDAQRTGFLAYGFSDGTVMNVHTHWARADMRLKSMHVQDLQGDNGLEMNEWSWFADVANEVVAAHNRATGNLRPSKSGRNATSTYADVSR